MRRRGKGVRLISCSAGTGLVTVGKVIKVSWSPSEIAVYCAEVSSSADKKPQVGFLPSNLMPLFFYFFEVVISGKHILDTTRHF